MGFTQNVMSLPGITPLVTSPHAEIVVGGQSNMLPWLGFTPFVTRATLQSRSSRSPPRPPGDGLSNVSQKA
ncbi:MAG: hypothetical protein JNK04_05185, partial [Myxococcales bacterium]|nr:hypothetical protein [Myxococcales bacterium]